MWIQGKSKDTKRSCITVCTGWYFTSANVAKCEYSSPNTSVPLANLPSPALPSEVFAGCGDRGLMDLMDTAHVHDHGAGDDEDLLIVYFNWGSQ